MITDTFNNGGCSRVSNAESLPNLATKEELSISCPIQDDVARNDLVFRREWSVDVRPHDEAPSRKTLPDIVVRVSKQRQGDATGNERAKTLTSRAGKGDSERVWLESTRAKPLRYLVASQGANSPITICDRKLQVNRRPMLQEITDLRNDSLIERLFETVVLRYEGSSGYAIE